MPLLQASVAIPALNEEEYLPRLLRSLCRQRGVDLDVVVAEGHSDDRTVEVTRRVIEQNTNPRVSIRIDTVEKRNVSVQRNHAVAQSRHGLLLFFDADVQVPHPYWVRDVLRKHLHRGTAISTCRFIPSERNAIAYLYYVALYVFHQTMRWVNPYALGAMLLTSRELFDRVGGFDTELTLNEDANFVKRISEYGPFDVLPDSCLISARRFLKGGFFKTGLMYLRIFLHRTWHGEMQHDMGYWND